MYLVCVCIFNLLKYPTNKALQLLMSDGPEVDYCLLASFSLVGAPARSLIASAQLGGSKHAICSLLLLFLLVKFIWLAGALFKG